MTVRTYCRRSKNDEGKQQFSLDVQLAGCTEMIARIGHGTEPRRDYVDDGRAGDDFHTRAGLKALLAEAQRGDIIVCCDQSRLGRDAIEVTLVIRDLVRDRGCRLYYYISGQQVAFATAIDQATTFIQGTGHQMELEAIRSRTREALRSRARNGQIAGGACYGYDLERKSDATGRRYTLAKVNPDQARIVKRIYEEYLAHRGLKGIAQRLNAEGVPGPKAGRRGSGSWAPSSIRPLLMPRYRGVYIHGRIKKERHTNGVVRVKAAPDEVIVIDIPEWRIVDDTTWFAVQSRFGTRERSPAKKGHVKYALSGLGTCARCGASIGATRVSSYGGDSPRLITYGCSKYRNKGRTECSVRIHQPIEEVENALIANIQHHVFGDQNRAKLIERLRAELTAQLPQQEADLTAMEAELVSVRGEHRRITKAIALADDIPELVAELKQRVARIEELEAKLASARTTPSAIRDFAEQAERAVLEQIDDLKTALADRQDLREVFLNLFPNGLSFEPAPREKGEAQVWKISGEAHYGVLVARSRLSSDPSASERSDQVPKESRPVSAKSPKRNRTKAREVPWSELSRDPKGARCNREGSPFLSTC